MQAHQILGVAPNADEETIRQRYLQLVREFPPDREPERFAEIRAAYDDLRDPVKALEQRLFSITGAQTLEAVVTEAKARLESRRYSTQLLLSLADN